MGSSGAGCRRCDADHHILRRHGKKGVEMIAGRTAGFLLLVIPALLSAQAQDERVLYYPKPLAKTRWQPPMQPITRLEDVKARHKDEAS
jgi:hypothetical protein